MKRVKWDQNKLLEESGDPIILEGNVEEESIVNYTVVVTTEGPFKGQTHIIPKRKSKVV